MRSFQFFTSTLLLSPVLLPSTAASTSQPSSGPCHGTNVVYKGSVHFGAERFLGIKFGQDTGGQKRFKPPVPYAPEPNHVIHANEAGPACPQQYPDPSNDAPPFFTYGSTYPTSISEDCLRLNVWRPKGVHIGDKLPVLVWIYGGSFICGFNNDIVSRPEGMISESIANGYPIIHVELNYRLGIFGFAQSQALEDEGSENAGLRDQRLALEWVQDNIAAFGGDPDKITMHGQSSGGLSVGIQLMAYGATRPVPFSAAICESQALEPGITGNFTREAMADTLSATACEDMSLDSPATLSCLRNLSMHALLHAQIETASGAASANIGDQWLPVVDGPDGFLPDAPSALIYNGRFANVPTIIGWTENDGLFYAPDIRQSSQARHFIRNYLPGFTDSNIKKLLSLYPSSDFHTSYFANGSVKLSSETYRTGRIIRDILFTCQPIFYGQHIAKSGNPLYLYQQNQTVLTPILHYYEYYGYGPIHTSELAYVFGNLSHNHQYDWPFHPSASDYQLKQEESRSWTSFAAVRQPSLMGHGTLQGWEPAQFEDENFGVYVIGGPNAGYSGPGGSEAAKSAMAAQKLQDRCGFLNSPEIVQQLLY